VAKRRNAKKEKAERNKMNARKFRKPSSRYASRGKRYSNNSNNNNSDKKSDGDEKQKSEDNLSSGYGSY
jgi:hypothetical protein